MVRKVVSKKKSTSKKVVKKTTRKNPSAGGARKVPVRKALSKRRVAKDIDPEKYFWINNGPVVRDLKELCDALSAMSDDQYYHHTKREDGVNDFARWVDDVFEDAELAQKLVKARSRIGSRRVIVAHISIV